jgi:hypothetical protein
MDELAIQNLQYQFLDMLRIARGNVGEACRSMKLGRDMYLRWLNDDRDFRFQVMVLIEEIGDNVEDELMKRIQEGDTQAIHRCYQEDPKAGNNVPTKTKINVMVNLPKQDTIEINTDGAEEIAHS